VESLAAWRKDRDVLQTAVLRLRGQHAKTRELQQVEEKRAALQQQAGQVYKDRSRIEASAGAVPLLPLLEEAARAASSAKMARTAAEQGKGPPEPAHKARETG